MLKPIEWMGSSKADLKRFPDPVQDRMGIATPKRELDLVRRRLRAAERHYRDTHHGD